MIHLFSSLAVLGHDLFRDIKLIIDFKLSSLEILREDKANVSFEYANKSLFKGFEDNMLKTDNNKNQCINRYNEYHDDDQQLGIDACYELENQHQHDL